MTAAVKFPMLVVLEQLAESPHWDSPEWVRAMRLAIQEAIREVGTSDPNLAARLFSVRAAIKSSDMQKALVAVLNTCRVNGETIVSTAGSPGALLQGVDQ